MPFQMVLLQEAVSPVDFGLVGSRREDSVSVFSIAVSSSASDDSGDDAGEVAWLVNPRHIVVASRELSVLLSAFGALSCCSLLDASSDAVWRMLSTPPAASIGYICSSAIPSMKASLSSQARTGEGGGIELDSSFHKLGERGPDFPKLKADP